VENLLKFAAEEFVVGCTSDPIGRSTGLEQEEEWALKYI
jgi:hypothetical protein